MAERSPSAGTSGRRGRASSARRGPSPTNASVALPAEAAVRRLRRDSIGGSRCRRSAPLHGARSGGLISARRHRSASRAVVAVAAPHAARQKPSALPLDRPALQAEIRRRARTSPSRHRRARARRPDRRPADGRRLRRPACPQPTLDAGGGHRRRRLRRAPVSSISSSGSRVSPDVPRASPGSNGRASAAGRLL